MLELRGSNSFWVGSLLCLRRQPIILEHLPVPGEIHPQLPSPMGVLAFKASLTYQPPLLPNLFAVLHISVQKFLHWAQEAWKWNTGGPPSTLRSPTSSLCQKILAIQLLTTNQVSRCGWWHVMFSWQSSHATWHPTLLDWTISYQKSDEPPPPVHLMLPPFHAS